MFRHVRAALERCSRTRGQTDRRFAFIVTYARSGSTLLQKIIASIPGSHFNGENHDTLAGLYASYRSACMTRHDQGEEPRKHAGDPWRGAHRIDPLRYNRRLAEVFIDEILQPPRDASLIGFKEVRYFDHDDDLLDYLDYIRMTFEPAMLIFNRRNAADVSKSAWWKDHPDDIEAAVRRFDQLTDRYSAQHPDHTIIVDYDIYCQDTNHLRPLFERLGAKFDHRAVRTIMSERLAH